MAAVHGPAPAPLFVVAPAGSTVISGEEGVIDPRHLSNIRLTIWTTLCNEPQWQVDKYKGKASLTNYSLPRVSLDKHYVTSFGDYPSLSDVGEAEKTRRINAMRRPPLFPFVMGRYVSTLKTVEAPTQEEKYMRLLTTPPRVEPLTEGRSVYVLPGWSKPGNTPITRRLVLPGQVADSEGLPGSIGGVVLEEIYIEGLERERKGRVTYELLYDSDSQLCVGRVVTAEPAFSLVEIDSNVGDLDEFKRLLVDEVGLKGEWTVGYQLLDATEQTIRDSADVVVKEIIWSAYDNTHISTRSGIKSTIQATIEREAFEEARVSLPAGTRNDVIQKHMKPLRVTFENLSTIMNRRGQFLPVIQDLSDEVRKFADIGDSRMLVSNAWMVLVEMERIDFESPFSNNPAEDQDPLDDLSHLVPVRIVVVQIPQFVTPVVNPVAVVGVNAQNDWAFQMSKSMTVPFLNHPFTVTSYPPTFDRFDPLLLPMTPVPRPLIPPTPPAPIIDIGPGGTHTIPNFASNVAENQLAYALSKFALVHGSSEANSLGLQNLLYNLFTWQLLRLPDAAGAARFISQLRFDLSGILYLDGKYPSDSVNLGPVFADGGERPTTKACEIIRNMAVQAMEFLTFSRLGRISGVGMPSIGSLNIRTTPEIVHPQHLTSWSELRLTLLNFVSFRGGVSLGGMGPSVSAIMDLHTPDIVPGLVTQLQDCVRTVLDRVFTFKDILSQQWKQYADDGFTAAMTNQITQDLENLVYNQFVAFHSMVLGPRFRPVDTRPQLDILIFHCVLPGGAALEIDIQAILNPAGYLKWASNVTFHPVAPVRILLDEVPRDTLVHTTVTDFINALTARIQNHRNVDNGIAATPPYAFVPGMVGDTIERLMRIDYDPNRILDDNPVWLSTFLDCKVAMTVLSDALRYDSVKTLVRTTPTIFRNKRPYATREDISIFVSQHIPYRRLERQNGSMFRYTSYYPPQKADVIAYTPRCPLTDTLEASSSIIFALMLGYSMRRNGEDYSRDTLMCAWKLFKDVSEDTSPIAREDTYPRVSERSFLPAGLYIEDLCEPWCEHIREVMRIAIRLNLMVYLVCQHPLQSGVNIVIPLTSDVNPARPIHTIDDSVWLLQRQTGPTMSWSVITMTDGIMNLLPALRTVATNRERYLSLWRFPQLAENNNDLFVGARIQSRWRAGAAQTRWDVVKMRSDLRAVTIQIGPVTYKRFRLQNDTAPDFDHYWYQEGANPCGPFDISWKAIPDDTLCDCIEVGQYVDSLVEGSLEMRLHRLFTDPDPVQPVDFFRQLLRELMFEVGVRENVINANSVADATEIINLSGNHDYWTSQFVELIIKDVYDRQRTVHTVTVLSEHLWSPVVELLRREENDMRGIVQKIVDHLWGLDLNGPTYATCFVSILTLVVCEVLMPERWDLLSTYYGTIGRRNFEVRGTLTTGSAAMVGMNALATHPVERLLRLWHYVITKYVPVPVDIARHCLECLMLLWPIIPNNDVTLRAIALNIWAQIQGVLGWGAHFTLTTSQLSEIQRDVEDFVINRDPPHNQVISIGLPGFELWHIYLYEFFLKRQTPPFTIDQWSNAVERIVQPVVLTLPVTGYSLLEMVLLWSYRRNNAAYIPPIALQNEVNNNVTHTVSATPELVEYLRPLSTLLGNFGINTVTLRTFLPITLLVGGHDSETKPETPPVPEETGEVEMLKREILILQDRIKSVSVTSDAPAPVDASPPDADPFKPDVTEHIKSAVDEKSRSLGDLVGKLDRSEDITPHLDRFSEKIRGFQDFIKSSADLWSQAEKLVHEVQKLVSHCRLMSINVISTAFEGCRFSPDLLSRLTTTSGLGSNEDAWSVMIACHWMEHRTPEERSRFVSGVEVFYRCVRVFRACLSLRGYVLSVASYILDGELFAKITASIGDLEDPVYPQEVEQPSRLDSSVSECLVAVHMDLRFSGPSCNTLRALEAWSLSSLGDCGALDVRKIITDDVYSQKRLGSLPPKNMASVSDYLITESEFSTVFKGTVVPQIRGIRRFVSETVRTLVTSMGNFQTAQDFTEFQKNTLASASSRLLQGYSDAPSHYKAVALELIRSDFKKLTGLESPGFGSIISDPVTGDVSRAVSLVERWSSLSADLSADESVIPKLVKMRFRLLERETRERTTIVAMSMWVNIDQILADVIHRSGMPPDPRGQVRLKMFLENSSFLGRKYGIRQPSLFFVYTTMPEDFSRAFETDEMRDMFTLSYRLVYNVLEKDGELIILDTRERTPVLGSKFVGLVITPSSQR